MTTEATLERINNRIKITNFINIGKRVIINEKTGDVVPLNGFAISEYHHVYGVVYNEPNMIFHRLKYHSDIEHLSFNPRYSKYSIKTDIEGIYDALLEFNKKKGKPRRFESLTIFPEVNNDNWIKVTPDKIGERDTFLKDLIDYKHVNYSTGWGKTLRKVFIEGYHLAEDGKLYTLSVNEFWEPNVFIPWVTQDYKGKQIDEIITNKSPDTYLVDNEKDAMMVNEDEPLRISQTTYFFPLTIKNMNFRPIFKYMQKHAIQQEHVTYQEISVEENVEHGDHIQCSDSHCGCGDSHCECNHDTGHKEHA